MAHTKLMIHARSKLLGPVPGIRISGTHTAQTIQHRQHRPKSLIQRRFTLGIQMTTPWQKQLSPPRRKIRLLLAARPNHLPLLTQTRFINGTPKTPPKLSRLSTPEKIYPSAAERRCISNKIGHS